MAEPYVGRVEHAASGQGVIEVDDLDAPDWVGAPIGGFLANGNAPDVWLVGVILLDGPRAWEYATADLVVTHDDAGMITSVRFHGKTSFAPTLDRAELDAAQQRVHARRQLASNMRRLIPNDEEPFFAHSAVSVLARAKRPVDEWPERLQPVRERIRPETSRLALDHRGHRIYVARGIGGDLYEAHLKPTGGGGASGGPLSNLAQRGVSFSISHGTGQATVTGIVHDEVIAVRVDGRHAVMGQNAFIAFLDTEEIMNGLTLTTVDREYELRVGSPLDV